MRSLGHSFEAFVLGYYDSLLLCDSFELLIRILQTQNYTTAALGNR